MRRVAASALGADAPPLAAALARYAATPVAAASGAGSAADASIPQQSSPLLCNLPFKVEDILSGQRRALAKAITMVESDNPSHAAVIGELLRAVQRLRNSESPSSSTARDANVLLHSKFTPRIAISGSPGAGKSCFIEAFGMYLVEQLGLKVGVIAVDPSSSITGGSILGDKTRMEKLSMHPNAFVRPSPSRGHLGGVTARAWEVMSLLESAHFDVVLVETVGVGQSEVAAKYMTDVMILLVPPASGDELQGIKKGIVEVADMILVTKNDGERTGLAQTTMAAYRRAVQYGDNCGIDKQVLAVSSELGTNIDAVWTTFSQKWQRRIDSGDLAHSRQVQQAKHFESYFEQELLRRAKEMLAANGGLWGSLHNDVFTGQRAPREAGELALREVLRPKKWFQ
jgi:LAO/AO transport system kinase